MKVFGKSVGYLCVMGLFVVTLFAGCGKQVPTTEEVITEKETTETITTTEEVTEEPTTTTSNDFEGGLNEDGKGILQEEDLIGEWLYVQQGCILTFKEDGICNVMYEGKDYACTYKCEDDQVILIYDEKETIGTIHDDDSMLYFNDSKFGFMTSYVWENSGVESDLEENNN